MEDNKQENEEDLGNKSKLKRKMRAWCGLCYQFFENGPTAKNCKDHFLKGNCNLVDCKKASNVSKCVRRFPNTNSENRHTYCLSQEEVANWDPSCNIQNCLRGLNVSQSGREKEKEKHFNESDINILGLSQQVFLDHNDSFLNKLNDTTGLNIFQLEGNKTNPWEEKNINKDSISKDLSLLEKNGNESVSAKMANPKFGFDLSYDKESHYSGGYFVNNSHNSLLANSSNDYDSLSAKSKIVSKIFDASPKKRVDYEDSLVDEFSKIYFNTGMTPKKDIPYTQDNKNG